MFRVCEAVLASEALLNVFAITRDAPVCLLSSQLKGAWVTTGWLRGGSMRVLSREISIRGRGSANQVEKMTASLVAVFP